MKIYRQLLNQKTFKMVDKNFPSYEPYKKEKQKHLKNQIDLTNFTKEINENNKKDILLESLDNIKEDYIYQSNIHGINHNERVSLYGFYIGVKNNLEDQNLKLLLEACKYHDIGRINDIEDKAHGYRSSKMIETFEPLTKEELKVLKCMITYHSIDDYLLSNLANHYEIKDKDNLQLLCNILKDSDALDRTRGGTIWGLNTNFLRTEQAKEMVYLAYELLYNYEQIKKEQKNKERKKEYERNLYWNQSRQFKTQR